MVKFVKQMIGAQVLLFQERLRVGKVSDVLIDPKDGSFAGVEVIAPKEKRPRYVPPTEIKGFGPNFLMVKGLSSVSEADDVVKIKEILKDRFRIISAKVYYESGEYIGKVDDATVNFSLSALEKLYVTPKISVKFFSESLIIPAKSILRIEKGKIFIRNGRAKKRTAKSAVAPATVTKT